MSLLEPHGSSAAPTRPGDGTDTASRCVSNAGVSVAPGPGRGRVASRPDPAERKAKARRPAAADAGTDGPTPIRRGKTPSSSLLLLSSSGNFSRRPSPPVDPWGQRPPRWRHGRRLIRPRGPWHSHRPLAARMTRVFERRAGCSGTPGHHHARPSRHLHHRLAGDVRRHCGACAWKAVKTAFCYTLLGRGRRANS